MSLWQAHRGTRQPEHEDGDVQAYANGRFAAMQAAAYLVTGADGQPRPSFTPAPGFDRLRGTHHAQAARTMTGAMPAVTEAPREQAPPVPAGAPPWERLPVFEQAESAIIRASQAVTAPEPPPAPAPLPVPVAVPAPESAWPYPEGYVRGMLIDRLWDATGFYGDLDGITCDDCTADGRCDWHEAQQGKRREYRRLHDLAVVSTSDAAAVAGIIASVRAGTADPGDIAGPGSPCGVILADALAAMAGAR
jgi:hypothetical protein